VGPPRKLLKIRHRRRTLVGFGVVVLVLLIMTRERMGYD
jgi:hypothetical protein